MRNEITIFGIAMLLLCLGKTYCSEEIQPRELPCPLAEDIFPCECWVLDSIAPYKLSMVCDDVTSDEELRTIFSKPFPFNNFYYISIFENEHITSLSSGLFGDKTFEYIRISGINLKTVASDVFSNMEQTLHTVSLRNGALTKFDYDFTNFVMMNTIELTNNKISSFKLFAPTLQTLDMNENMLRLSKDGVVVDAPNLRYLKVAANNLDTLPDMSQYNSLIEVDFQLNSLTSVESNALCHSNQMHTIELQGNQIATIAEDSLCVDTFGFIYLDNNQLTTMDESIYAPITEHVMFNGLHLSGNPFLCACDIAWLITDTPSEGDYMHFISEDSACSGGELFTDINPQFYEDNCPALA